MAKIDNHRDRALSLLASQFATAPRLQGVIGAIADQVQAIEDTLDDLILDRMVTQAVGAQLDRLGEIVVESRLGRADTAYRAAIRFKIGLNASKGTPDEVMTYAQAFSGSSTVEYSEVYPAKIRLGLAVPVITAALIEQILGVVPVGVDLEIVMAGEALAFSWLDDPQLGGFWADTAGVTPTFGSGIFQDSVDVGA